MKLEGQMRTELFKDSEDIQTAKSEIKDRIEEDVQELAMRYGRTAASHALKKAWIDFNNRRWVNPYAIDDEKFEKLVEATQGSQNKVHVNDKSPSEMGEVFIHIVNKMEDDDDLTSWEMVDGFTEEELTAWVDLHVTNLFVEERDRYVREIVDTLMDKAEDEV